MTAVSGVGPLRRGLPALLCVHALRTAWALLLLGPVYAELGRAIDGGVFRARAAPGDAALALEVIAGAAPAALPGALACLVSYALLGPWLQSMLFHGLAGARLRTAATRAARRYPAALGTRVVALGAFASIAGVLVLVLWVVPAWLPASEPLEAALRASCVSVLLACGLGLASAHDLALARVAHGDRLGAALRAGIVGCESRTAGRNLLALAGAAALVALAELAGRVSLELPYALGPAVVLLAQQSLLLAALAVRAIWLAHSLTLTLSPRRS